MYLYSSSHSHKLNFFFSFPKARNFRRLEASRLPHNPPLPSILMTKKSKKNRNVTSATPTPQDEEQLQQSNCYEGERLVNLIHSLQREIESAKLSKGALPEKIWLKQQFSVGVNDVTRVLERMKPSSQSGSFNKDLGSNKLKSSVQLQAILVASDCKPQWLIKHLPILASSRKVPLIYVKDNKGGSLRLGELVKLKTAIAVGVKVKGSGINKLIAETLCIDANVSDIG